MMEAKPELGFASCALLNPEQVSLDIEVLKIEVAVISLPEGTLKDKNAALGTCEKIRVAAPSCRVLLLLSQDDVEGKKLAVEAIRDKLADDFVFYDTSLSYLFAKLSAIT